LKVWFLAWVLPVCFWVLIGLVFGFGARWCDAGRGWVVVAPPLLEVMVWVMFS
jgi:hypothetical protein